MPYSQAQHTARNQQAKIKQCYNIPIFHILFYNFYLLYYLLQTSLRSLWDWGGSGVGILTL